ncbi:MAG: response regulator [Sphingobacteriia bacterium]|jgi:DNA-binding response OmpR family regulator
METIVVIDDDQEILSATCKILELSGFKTIRYLDGNEFLLNRNSIGYQLILCDMMMPKIDGLTILQLLRKSGNNIPFIFLTAKSQYEDLRTSMILGADDYIFKPIKAKVLIESINARLNRIGKITNKIKSLEDTIHLMLGHEFKTPMHGIKAFMNMIQNKSKELNNDDLLEYCNYLEISVERLQNTFKKINLYYEIKERKYINPIQSLVANFDEFVYEITNSVANHFNRTADVVYKLKSNASLTKDSFLLSDVITEVIENAFKFSKNNELVTIATELISERTIQLTISDYGIENIAAALNSINEFKQLTRERKEQQGLGIGISLVKLALEELGSSISFSNNHPKGVIATIQLCI